MYILKLYESEVVELKERYTLDLKKEVLAFVNTVGGILYIGVNDEGEIIGIENPDTEMQRISSSLKDSIKPDISMFIKVELLKEQDKFYIKISVEQGSKKPYYLSEKGMKSSGVYIRSGSSSIQASEDHIRNMIKESDFDNFELNFSIIQDLSFNVLEKELKERGMEFTDIQKKNLGIISIDGTYTNMGLLVSDQCKHSIKFAVFQGNNKLHFKDRKEFGGSLFEQLNKAYEAIDFYNRTGAYFKALIRVDEREYPEIAIREALLNAIIHRDYSFSGSIFINLYTDRLEIISLGGLVSNLSMEAAMLGVSQPRNNRLASLFYRMRLIEAYGTGINKIVSSYQDTGLSPEFESVEGAFRVTLPSLYEINTLRENHDDFRRLDGRNKKYSDVLRLFEIKKELTRLDMEKYLNIGTTRAVTILKEMQRVHLIEKIGKGKFTRYKLK